jgi:hypothetical protein
MNETQSESLQESVKPMQHGGIARRRLLRAGLAATPVVLTLSGRSAMAATGDPCAGLSGAAWTSLVNNGTCTMNSHTVASTTIGSRPVFWNAKSPKPSYMDNTFSGIFGGGSINPIKQVISDNNNDYEVCFSTAYCNVLSGNPYPIDITALKTLYSTGVLAGKPLTPVGIVSFLKQTWGG